jgi:hypothetical protein
MGVSLSAAMGLGVGHVLDLTTGSSGAAIVGAALMGGIAGWNAMADTRLHEIKEDHFNERKYWTDCAFNLKRMAP